MTTPKISASLRSSVEKKQRVFKVGKKSYTRFVENGVIRSLKCNHGTSCQNCFIRVEDAKN